MEHADSDLATGMRNFQTWNSLVVNKQKEYDNQTIVDAACVVSRISYTGPIFRKGTCGPGNWGRVEIHARLISARGFKFVEGSAA